MTPNILEVSNLHKSFGAKKVLKDVNLTVAPGEVFGLLGPNGAGKTTTVRIILGLVRPDRGTVLINGVNLRSGFKQAISRVGAVFETPRFYPYLSGYQNLSLAANLHYKSPAGSIERALKIAGLSERARDPVRTYSMGMRQRLGIARALVNNPRLVFLDEPMNGLDPQGIIEVRETIRRLANEQGTAFFLTSHLLHEVEQVCGRVAIIKEGQVIAQGAVEELLSRESETVAVHTPDAGRACRVLKGVEYVRAIWPSGGRLTVELDRGLSGKLNQHLVNQGIQVDYLAPADRSLENLYMALTGGGADDD